MTLNETAPIAEEAEGVVDLTGGLTVSIQRLDPDLPVPVRVRAGDAAADFPARESVEIAPGERVAVPTGFAVAIPVGYAGLVVPRSGLARKAGVTVVNGPGLIDPGYRGEVIVLLLNTSSETVIIERGDRIAQLLVVPAPMLNLVEVSELPDAPDERGASGFGSSGR